MNFLVAYLVTLVAETTVLLFLLRKHDWHLVVAASVFASSITLVSIWFGIIPFLFGTNEYALLIAQIRAIWPVVLFLELLAVAAEAAIYKRIFVKIGWKQALMVSFAANAVSFIIGLVL